MFGGAVPGGVVVLVFDGFGVQGAADEGGPDEFFDADGWGGWSVDLGGGGDGVEAFGDRGAGGGDPHRWWRGLPAVFRVVVSGGAVKWSTVRSGSGRIFHIEWCLMR